jgi:copper(I)-binding protein
MRYQLLLFPALAGLLVFAAAGCGDDDDTGNQPVAAITISDPFARVTTNDTGAVYFTVKNSGEADRLVAADSPDADDTQVHEIVTEGSTTKMQEVKDGIPVPAGGEVRLAPGGYHVMLLGLREGLKEGDTVRVTLRFERAGQIQVEARVQPWKPGEGGHEMEGHQHGEKP